MRRLRTYYYRCLRHACTATILLLLALPHSVCAGDLDVYFGWQDFRWREIDLGEQVLEEHGPLYSLGFVYTTHVGRGLTLRPALEVFGGTVGYEGRTVTGTAASTDTDYYGGKLECDLGSSISGKNKDLIIEPFAGLGIRAWTRELRHTTLADGTPAAGYPEDWLSLYARLGLLGSGDLSPGAGFFILAGVKLPFYNRMTAYQASIGGQDMTFHPGNEASWFVEAGIRIARFQGSVFYDSLRFSKSDTVITTEGLEQFQNYQPESHADMYGVKLGIAF